MGRLRTLWRRLWGDHGEWSYTTSTVTLDAAVWPKSERPPARPKRGPTAEANAKELCEQMGHTTWHNVCVVCYEHVEEAARESVEAGSV